MLSTQLEQFLKSAQDIEGQLNEERRKNQKIARDYLQTRHTLEAAVKQLKDALQSREVQVKSLEGGLTSSQSKEKQLESMIHAFRSRDEQMQRTIEELRRVDRDFRAYIELQKAQIEAQFQQQKAEAGKTAEELSHYKAAWAQVMERDQEARMILSEREKWKQKVDATEERFDQVKKSLAVTTERLERSEKHSEQYQKELQSVLIRLQSAEGKFNQLQKEYQLVSQNKKNAEEEIQRYEQQMQERLKWEVATQKEKLKAEYEREAALERERFRELSRKSVQNEIEKLMAGERARMKQISEDFERLSIENQKLRQTSAAGESSVREAEERIRRLELDRHEGQIQAKREIKEWRDKTQSLTKDLDAVRDAEERVRKLELEGNDTHSQLKRELRGLRDKVHSLTSESESLRTGLKTVQLENETLKSSLKTATDETNTLRNGREDRTQIQTALEKKLLEIKGESVKFAAEKNQLSLQMDDLRRQHSKQILIEKFRHEQDLEVLQERIDRLERKGCKIGKIEEELADGAFVYIAEPVPAGN